MPGTAADLIKVVTSQVGVHEGRNSDGTWNNHQKYSTELPGFDWSDGEPWCDTFCGWGFWKAGLTEDEAPRSASCDASAAAWKKMGRYSEFPAVGAQVLFGVPGDYQHTGIVTRFDDTYIWTVEGNTNATGSYQGDGVYAKKHERRDPRVIGYGYPKFSHPIVSADPKWQHTPTPHPEPVVKPWPVNGVDISHHQDGPIDWAAAKKAGVQWVSHKATEGNTFTDPNYTRRRGEATKAGVPFGAYHFARPQAGDAAAEATRFLDVAKPKPGDLVPMLDLEDNGGLSRAALTTWVRTFVATVEKAVGVKPLIYTPFDLDDTCGCLLWVARYNNDNEAPRTPAPWKRWDIHQFSNGQYGVPHTVPGFGAVDLDTMRPGLTLEQLRIPGPRPAPHPQPHPTPEVEADFYVAEISGKWNAPDDAWKQAFANAIYAGATVILCTESTVDGRMRRVCPDRWDFGRLDDNPGESECSILWSKAARRRASEPYATVLSETQFHTEQGHLRPPVTSITESLEDVATGDLDLFTAVHTPSGDTDPRIQAHVEVMDSIPEAWDIGLQRHPDAGRVLGVDTNRNMRQAEMRQAWDEAFPMLAQCWTEDNLPTRGTRGDAVLDLVAVGRQRLAVVSATVLPHVDGLDHNGVLVGVARVTHHAELR